MGMRMQCISWACPGTTQHHHRHSYLPSAPLSLCRPCPSGGSSRTRTRSAPPCPWDRPATCSGSCSARWSCATRVGGQWGCWAWGSGHAEADFSSRRLPSHGCAAAGRDVGTRCCWWGWAWGAPIPMGSGRMGGGRALGGAAPPASSEFATGRLSSMARPMHLLA